MSWPEAIFGSVISISFAFAAWAFFKYMLGP